MALNLHKIKPLVSLRHLLVEITSDLISIEVMWTVELIRRRIQLFLRYVINLMMYGTAWFQVSADINKPHEPNLTPILKWAEILGSYPEFSGRVLWAFGPVSCPIEASQIVAPTAHAICGSAALFYINPKLGSIHLSHSPNTISMGCPDAKWAPKSQRSGCMQKSCPIVGCVCMDNHTLAEHKYILGKG